ncbi:MAG: TIGR03086 family protein [Pseudonocardiaceae bacterium]|nr:TIGR03086 family protein [Pseudonocardiaceae bacterium]
MRLLEAHGIAMAGFDRVVHEITEEQWSHPTPCTEWTVQDLLNHLVSEQLWAPWLLRKYTLAEVGDRFDGWLLGDDPVTAWEQAAAVARSAFTAAGALHGKVHVTGGEIEAESYGWQMTTDLTVHGWDLAMAIGTDDPVDQNVARALLAELEPQVDDWQGAGIFDPPVPVDEDAPAGTRLVALLGRNPRHPLGP